MQQHIVSPRKGLAMPINAATMPLVKISSSTHFIMTPASYEIRRVPRATCQCVAFIQHEAVEGSDGKYLGVPIMQYVPLSLWELGCGETFHAGSVCPFLSAEDFYKCIEHISYIIYHVSDLRKDIS